MQPSLKDDYRYWMKVQATSYIITLVHAVIVRSTATVHRKIYITNSHTHHYLSPCLRLRNKGIHVYKHIQIVQFHLMYEIFEMIAESPQQGKYCMTTIIFVIQLWGILCDTFGHARQMFPESRLGHRRVRFHCSTFVYISLSIKCIGNVIISGTSHSTHTIFRPLTVFLLECVHSLSWIS